MLRKALFSICFLNIFSYCAQVDIYALDVQKKGDIIEANSDVLVFSDLYFISANKAIYNEKTSEIELFGDVNILKGANERSSSSYAKIKLNSNEASFEDFFFSNNNLEIWFKSKNSHSDDDKFSSKISSVSSCNVENPDWEIRFSDGYINKQTNFVHLYNARLYVKEVPVFYLPYFGFSADTKRKTGLLLPTFVVKQSEGVVYKQPIYFTYYDNWDFQIDPQIRTSRGFGAYSTFRFIDTPYSEGELNFGAFREKNFYYEKENLKNKTHYGIEFRYLSENIFKRYLGDNYQEGLWVDANYLNDIDYFNLMSYNYENLTSLVTSKINYFLADENNYYGAYARYYIDTSKLSNKSTLQEFPSFQYHRFLNSLFDDKLRYFFDANFNNYYRSLGSYSNQINMNLPISYHTNFFDDFVQFTFTESLSASFVDYARDPAKDQEHMILNSHNFDIYVDLSKAYDNFYHTINFGFNYFLPGAKSGYISSNYLDIEDWQRSFGVNLVQYFYNNLGEKKIKHRFNTIYNDKLNKFQSSENSITYYYNDIINFNNDVKYSYMQNRFSKIITQANVELEKMNFLFTHAYENNDDIGKNSFISTKVNYNINRNYNLFGGIWFDVARAHPNMWEVGYTYQRKCWNYSLMYRERVDPQLTSAGINAKMQSGFYFVFNFYPLGGVKYDFSLEESENRI